MDIDRREFLMLVTATPFLKVHSEGLEHWKGKYCYGEGVESFTPNKSNFSFWLVGPNKITRKLREMHGKITKEPYQEIEVTLIGTYANCERDGYAEDYDGLFFAEEVV